DSDVRGRDRSKLIKAFGSEPAATEFERLERQRHSVDPRRSDEASAEFERRYGKLTPDQERLVYGIGEHPDTPQMDDVREVLRAKQDAAWLPDAEPQHVIDEAAQALSRLRPEAVRRVIEGRG